MHSNASLRLPPATTPASGDLTACEPYISGISIFESRSKNMELDTQVMIKHLIFIAMP
jgi:hypothetical protein